MKLCDCGDKCERSGPNFWAPYVPSFVEGHDITCKLTIRDDKVNSVVSKDCGCDPKNETDSKLKSYFEVEYPATFTAVSFIEVLKQRIIDRGISWNASDNISEIFENDEERWKLIDEVADRFSLVLDGLLIDQVNDPNSAGTARRLSKMYINEIMSGRYFPQPDVTAFPNTGKNSYNGMLIVRSEIKSMCSHHHQTVSGTCYIGIIPGDKVIGLSKYTRIAQWCARRGTLQEELCNDIANAIMDVSESDHVGVYIEAEHGCCTNRGIMAKSSMTQTTVLHGDFHNADVKHEFFDNIKLQRMNPNT